MMKKNFTPIHINFFFYFIYFSFAYMRLIPLLLLFIFFPFFFLPLSFLPLTKQIIFAASGKGKVGNLTYVDKHIPSLPTLGARQEAYSVSFDYDADFGIPGAFYFKNFTQDEFFFVSLTLEDIPNHGTIHFVCNSWVYNAKNYKKDRIFFTNDVIQLYIQSCEFHFSLSTKK
uniref:PLAT domain-containing protein n=1 Tax=Lotus japonicus TaxID=34305 RepID=I3SW69_LOTJA|nr:unknown [Lotus japonicus]